ncbi:cyclin-dependent kinase regulatory subunit [Cystoisospora suis]|uniref:Cyclin-dependent kinases regulatory subunit n=1 Tax=Cystoisospora suis TaxID=483139 RepID=A0A2C6JV60_9APIC|nr:cyclin-dependent kinase regulatory subunit [Cystoisospora suis]
MSETTRATPFHLSARSPPTLGTNENFISAADGPRNSSPPRIVCTSCCPSCTISNKTLRSKRRWDGAARPQDACGVEDSSPIGAGASLSTAVSSTSKDLKESFVYLGSEAGSRPVYEKGFRVAARDKHPGSTGVATEPDDHAPLNPTVPAWIPGGGNYQSPLNNRSEGCRPSEGAERAALPAPIGGGSCKALVTNSVSAGCTDLDESSRRGDGLAGTAVETAPELVKEKPQRSPRGCKGDTRAGACEALLQNTGQSAGVVNNASRRRAEDNARTTAPKSKAGAVSRLQREWGQQSSHGHLLQNDEPRHNVQPPSSINACCPDLAPVEARAHRCDVVSTTERSWATLPWRGSREPPAEREGRLLREGLPEERDSSTAHPADTERERISRTSPALSIRVRSRDESSDEEESFWEFDFEDDWFLQDGAEEASGSQAPARPATTARGAKETMEEMRLVELMQALVTEAIKQRIVYSEKYSDDAYEYRTVTLPMNHPFLSRWTAAQNLSDWRLKKPLTEKLWRSLGIRMSTGWLHRGWSPYEPHVFFFAKPRLADAVLGESAAEKALRTRHDRLRATLVKNIRKGIAKVCPLLDANVVLKNDWLLMEDAAETVDELLDHSATPSKRTKVAQSSMPSLYELFLFNHALRFKR